MSHIRIHPASLEAGRLASECDAKRTRRSGPGGQNRNKVETTVVLHHRPTGIGAEASVSVNTDHDDFPSLLAESLDVLAHHGMDVKSAAAALGCTSSQLTKFLKSEPRALAQINQTRRGAGLHPLQ